MNLELELCSAPSTVGWYLNGLSAHPFGHLHHDVDVDAGLLVLVDQAHQLLCVAGTHQNHGPRQRVQILQLLGRESGGER